MRFRKGRIKDKGDSPRIKNWLKWLKEKTYGRKKDESKDNKNWEA
jgi:hypothetical protein